MSAKPHPTPDSHPLIFKLSRELGAPISFFDTETTGLGHQKPTFGFTEVGFFSILPEGKTYAYCKLVDPENTIEEAASNATGITQEMVQGQPNFAAHADKVARMMEKSIPVGFNSASFDIPAILGQFDRYGIARPAASRNVDLRHIWKMAHGKDKGTQSAVAEFYGVPFTGAHRALDDVLALPDILEQMLWRHGTDLFHKTMRNDWDGPSASASASAPRAPKGELTETQKLLKLTIDEALAKKPSVEEFNAALNQKGFELELTRFGGSRYIAKGANAPEKVSGSDLGSGYSWKAVRTLLTGEVPASLVTNSPPTEKGSSSPQDKDARAADEAKARAALLAQIERGATRIDMEIAVADSEVNPRTVSFALTALLVDGSVTAAHVRDDAAQAWLDERWANLPTDGKLTPLLDACKAAGAPESVDFIQLRVAKATKAVNDPSKAPRPAQQQRPAPAPAPVPEQHRPAYAPAPASAPQQQRPAYAPAPASAHQQQRPAYAPRPAPAPAISLHDDIPPFDDEPPSASRHAP